jgi:DNA-directed RNA polymerase subunit alpha
MHEFQDIPHVKEDVPDIVYNLKKIRLRSYANRNVQIHLDVRGAGMVTAADIQTPSTIEIVTLSAPIATLDNEDAHLVMDLVVGTGRGFVEADAQAEPELPIGVIPIDAIYSPLLKVSFTVEHIHGRGLENLDKIVLEMTTDGTISPDEALRESAEILRRQFAVFANYSYRADETQTATQTALSDVPIPKRIYNLPIEELRLSARVQNSLRRYGITKVGYVLEKERDDLLAMRNIGEKALQELYDGLQSKGCFPVLGAEYP